MGEVDFFFSSRRRHTRFDCDWSSDVCSSDLGEKEKERLQAFEGVVISKKGRASSATFTVRRVSFGVGIERIFPLHSPTISSIEVVGKGKVRRARLYYLRDLKGKAARIKRAGREEVAAVATAGTEAKA